MALAHPFQPVTHRRHRILGRPSSGPLATAHESAPATAAAAGAPRTGEAPAGRPVRGIPRELVLDDAGTPRRSVLLAAIMVRRGRSTAEITAATGLPVDVVTALRRSI